MSGRALSALLGLALLAGCHEGDPQGTGEPPHPIAGSWRDIDDGNDHFFGPDKEYDGGIPGDRWRRQARNLIAIWTAAGGQTPETVDARFATKDCATLTWRSDGGLEQRRLARKAPGEEKYAQCPSP